MKQKWNDFSTIQMILSVYKWLYTNIKWLFNNTKKNSSSEDGQNRVMGLRATNSHV